MNLFDFLRNNNNVENLEQPTVNPVLLNVDGTMQENPVIMPENTSKIDAVKARLEQKTNNAGNKLADLLFGKQAQPTDNINKENNQVVLKDALTGDNVSYDVEDNATVSENPRRGGLFRDISIGYNENLRNPISLNNFTENMTPDGRNKGFAYRIGEGLGSLSRFAQSPLGRGLIVGGTVLATGGGALPALAFGGMTSGLNQQYRNNNRIYRDDLIENAKQQLMASREYADMEENAKKEALQAIEDKYNGLRGYVTNDAYNNLIRSQQIRDNYAYRNMMLNNQLEQNKIMNQLRQDQFKAQQDQNAFNNYIKERDLQEKANDRAFRASEGAANRAVQMRGQDISASKETAADRKAREKEKQSMSTINMINQAKKAVSNNPNAFKWTTGALGAEVANRIDPKGVQARSVVNSVTAEYRKYLTGAQMSDRERKDYEKFLPAPTDNARIIQDKLNGMLTVISAREGLSSRGGDPLGIR